MEVASSVTPAGQHFVEYAEHEGSVTGVVNVELVEVEQRTALQQRRHGLLDGAFGVCRRGEPKVPAVTLQLLEEPMEVNAPLALGRQLFEELVAQPGLASPDSAMEVDAARAFTVEDGRAEPVQPVDHALLVSAGRLGGTKRHPLQSRERPQGGFRLCLDRPYHYRRARRLQDFRLPAEPSVPEPSRSRRTGSHHPAAGNKTR